MFNWLKKLFKHECKFYKKDVIEFALTNKKIACIKCKKTHSDWKQSEKTLNENEVEFARLFRSIRDI